MKAVIQYILVNFTVLLVVSVSFAVDFPQIHENSLEISNKLIEISSEQDPQAKLLLSQMTTQLIKANEALLDSYFEEKGVQYQKVDSNPKVSDYFGVKWSQYRILGSKSTLLNRFAAKLEIEIGVRVVFDPLTLNLFGGNAAYVEAETNLYLTENSISTLKLDYVINHEIIHAYFHANRRGKTTYQPNAPVNIIFKSNSPIDPSGKYQVYSQFMSYEELVTHGYNILFFSKAVLNGLVIPGVRGVNGAQAKLDDGVNVLLAISNNALIASKRAIQILHNGGVPTLVFDKEKNQNYLKISSDESFEINIWMSPKELKNDFRDYAHKQLNKSIALAEFNLKYFSQFRDGTVNQVDARKALEFRRAQLNFINSTP